jgi:hypothetical protein
VKIADPDFLIQTNAIRVPLGEKVGESSLWVPETRFVSSLTGSVLKACFWRDSSRGA